MMNSIYLIGFMGSGKSTIGRELASKLSLQFVDTDVEIEKQLEKKITDIFAEEGESGFRRYEQQILKQMPQVGFVISTGGGIVELTENRAYLTDKKVIYLKANFETIVKRLSNDDSRPIWQDQSRDKKDLWSKRDILYKQVASHIIEIDRLTIEQVVDQIELLFE